MKVWKIILLDQNNLSTLQIHLLKIGSKQSKVKTSTSWEIEFELTLGPSP